MKLDFAQRLQAFKDMTHKNAYELREYVIKDGKKHPFAVICPGGGYSMVCSFVEQQITENDPPAFIWCGDGDRTVNPENSRMLEAALREKGVPCLRKEYPGVDHGVGLGKGLCCEGWIGEAVAFWNQVRKA